MKKWLSLLLVVMLILSIVPVASAEDVPTIVLYQNTGKISSTGTMGSTAEAYKAVQDYILEQTGIRVEVIVPEASSSAEKLNAMLASGQQIDLFQGNWNEFAEAIQPLNAALDTWGQELVSEWTAWDPTVFQALTDAEGNIMGMPRSGAWRAYPIWLRTDWLNDLNLATPTTVEELEAVLKAFAENDCAGNAQTIPLACDLAGLNYCLSAAFTGHGYGNYYDEATGEVKPVELHPGYKDFVAKVAEWYANGYVYQESFATDRSRYNELVPNGRFGSIMYWYSLVTQRSPYATEVDEDAQYDFITITGPAGPSETHTDASASGMLVPASSKNLEAVIKYCNWCMSSIDNHLVAELGLENVHWRWIDKESGLIETLNNDYVGEFVCTLGLVNETKYKYDQPMLAKHNAYLKNNLARIEGVLGADDAFVVYDNTAIYDACMSYSDITRMMTEETIKFMTGERDLSEWDDFIKQLYAIGMQDLVDEYTKQAASIVK